MGRIRVRARKVHQNGKISSFDVVLETRYLQIKTKDRIKFLNGNTSQERIYITVSNYSLIIHFARQKHIQLFHG